MKTYTLKTETHVSAPLDDVFAFFSQAENLGKLTPPSLQFEICTALPVDMRAGALIRYLISMFGIPMRWLTEITVWEPGRRFVDVQREGPYRQWEHEHVFEADGSGTRMVDTVRYALPGGIFAPIAHALFVRRQVEGIFRYREKAIRQYFPTEANRCIGERLLAQNRLSST